MCVGKIVRHGAIHKLVLWQATYVPFFSVKLTAWSNRKATLAKFVSVKFTFKYTLDYTDKVFFIIMNGLFFFHV